MTITIGIASTLSMSIPRHDRDHVTEKGATLKLDPHAPDHWRSTINADVHRRVVPGTQTSQGKGRGGGRSTGSAARVPYSAELRHHWLKSPIIMNEVSSALPCSASSL